MPATCAAPRSSNRSTPTSDACSPRRNARRRKPPPWPGSRAAPASSPNRPFGAGRPRTIWWKRASWRDAKAAITPSANQRWAPTWRRARWPPAVPAKRSSEAAGRRGGGWPPGEAAVGFFAALSDAGAIVQRWIEAGRDALETGTLDAARLLRYGSRKAAWRQNVRAPLAQTPQPPQRPYGLRLRAVDALVLAGEPTAAILFRRLLTAEAASPRLLSAGGVGGLAAGG